MQRLGLGYDLLKRNTPNQPSPYPIERVFDNPNVLNVAINGQQGYAVLQSGSIYSWGKPTVDKPNPADFEEFSTPYILFEEKQITFVNCGVGHMAAINRAG